MRGYFQQFAGALVFCATVHAQQAVIRTSTNEVVVDVVVRDKKGKLVSGLQAGDFTIFEDGKQQRVTSVREVSGSLVREAEGGEPGQRPERKLDATRRVRLLTLVFDRLGIDSRRLARQAANDLIREQLAPDVFISVFTCDLHLRAVQTFTNDRSKIREAIEKAAGSGAMTNYADANTALAAAVESSAGSDGAAASVGPQGTNVDGGAMAQESMNRMITDMLEFAQTSVQEQQGRSSIFGLWGVVSAQSRLPGRKTVLYFSEGMEVPHSLQPQFQSLISSANRANVSVYSIDARGLSVEGDGATGQQLLGTALRTSQRTYRSTEVSAAVTRQEATQFDKALDAIRANVQVNLADLAESTGGFLIANTNDFRKPLRQLTEDLGSYYEVVYRPANAELDGTFRAIETKVNRADVKVQSRSGYFALPSLDGASVMPHDVPLLEALRTTPPPRDVEFRASVLRGKPLQGRYQSTIVFEMPMKEITFRELDAEGAYRTHTSFLALVKDSQGHVLGKISRDLPVNQPKITREGFRSGRIIFTHPVALGPGRYTIEAAAADVEGKKIGARRTSLILPPALEGGLAMSTPVLVRRMDVAGVGSSPNDPFLVGGQRVIPTLQDRVPGGEQNALSFFFTLYPAPEGEKPAAVIEFLLEDKSLGGAPVALPQPHGDGSIPYVATIPLAGFSPGLYEVRIRAVQGQRGVQESFFVTIE
jgi:VWFA-related protein